MAKKRPQTFGDVVDFSDLLDLSDYTWPKKGDRLLRSTDDWERAVTFSPHAFDRHVHIWTGYTRAGGALVAEAEREPAERDFDSDSRDHNLWQLWKLCKTVILRLGSEGEDDEGLRAVEQLVKDFHDLDKDGTAFRYSNTKTGMTIELPDKPIDVQHIRCMMEAVDHFFAGVDGQLHTNAGNIDWYD
jgi:hypothetical protein